MPGISTTAFVIIILYWRHILLVFLLKFVSFQSLQLNITIFAIQDPHQHSNQCTSNLLSWQQWPMAWWLHALAVCFSRQSTPTATLAGPRCQMPCMHMNTIRLVYCKVWRARCARCKPACARGRSLQHLVAILKQFIDTDYEFFLSMQSHHLYIILHCITTSTWLEPCCCQLKKRNTDAKGIKHTGWYIFQDLHPWLPHPKRGCLQCLVLIRAQIIRGWLAEIRRHACK